MSLGKAISGAQLKFHEAPVAPFVLLPVSTSTIHAASEVGTYPSYRLASRRRGEKKGVEELRGFSLGKKEETEDTRRGAGGAAGRGTAETENEEGKIKR